MCCLLTKLNRRKIALLYRPDHEQPGDKMDLVVLCSYAVSVPMCIVAMIVVRHCGLRNTLNWSGGLTALGKILDITFS